MAGPKSILDYLSEPHQSLLSQDEEEMQYLNPYSLSQPVVQGGIEQRQYEADIRKPKFEYTPTFFGEEEKTVAPGYYERGPNLMGGEEQRNYESRIRKPKTEYKPTFFAEEKEEKPKEKSFLEKMFDKEIKEGELLSNKDKTFATMRAISDRLLRPANPGESKSLLSDIALGLGDGQDKIAALEDKEYNKQVTKSAADLEKLMTNAELLDIASKIEDRQMRGVSDAQLTVSQIAKNMRDASMIDPNSPQAQDLLTNDIRNAMAIVQGEGLQPGTAGYQKAIAAELLKNFDLDQKTALLESLDTEYIMMQDEATQDYLTNLKSQLIRELAGSGSGMQGNEIPYMGGVVNN